MDEEEKISWLMLNKLSRRNKIGGSHTEIKNLTKGLPEHYLRNKKGKKAVRRAIKELVRKKFIKVKSSTGELHVSINPEKIKEVSEFLERNR